ncbi:MAG: protein kinase domain-containing protein [Egibacteraceae bacterium]
MTEHTDAGPSLPWPVAADMIRRLARLLAAVHAEGLVLRDFTPNNVLITTDDEPRVVDLELAAPLGSEAITAGTTGYAAPEQFAGAPIATEADFSASELSASCSPRATTRPLPKICPRSARTESVSRVGWR